jgi:BMFP domain-containing protein YqiC
MHHNEVTAAIGAAVEKAGREAADELVAAVEQVMRGWFTRFDWLRPAEFEVTVYMALADVERLADEEAARLARIGGAR